MIKENKAYIIFFSFMVLFILPFLFIYAHPEKEIFAMNESIALPSQDEFSVYAARVQKASQDINYLGDYNNRENVNNFIDPHEKFPPLILGRLHALTGSVDLTYLITIAVVGTLTLSLIYILFLLLGLTNLWSVIGAFLVFLGGSIPGKFPVMFLDGMSAVQFALRLGGNYGLRFYNNLFGLFFLFAILVSLVYLIKYKKKWSWIWVGVVWGIGIFHTYIFLTITIPLVLFFVFLYALITRKEYSKNLFLAGVVSILVGLSQIIFTILYTQTAGYDAVSLRYASYGSFFHLYNLYTIVKYLLIGLFLHLLYLSSRKRMTEVHVILLSFLGAGLLVINSNIVTGIFFIQEHMENRILDYVVIFFLIVYIFYLKLPVLRRFSLTAIKITLLFLLLVGFPLHYMHTFDKYENKVTPDSLKEALDSIPEEEQVILSIGIFESHYLASKTTHYAYAPYAAYTIMEHQEVLKRVGQTYGFYGANETYLIWLLSQEKNEPSGTVSGRQFQEDWFEAQYFAWMHWNTSWHPLGEEVWLDQIPPKTRISDEDRNEIYTWYAKTLFQKDPLPVDYILVGPIEREVMDYEVFNKRNISLVYTGEYEVYRNEGS